MGPGVKPFCLQVPKTFLTVSNKPYSTYMAAASDYFAKFGPFLNYAKIIIFHAWEASWSPKEPKWALGGDFCPKM